MKKKIRAVYVVDASGSMGGQRMQTIEGVQQDLMNLREEEEKFGNIEYYVTLVVFNTKKKVLVDNVRLSDLEFDFNSQYHPSGGTALNQTVGEILELIPPNEENVLVTIITDGEELDSVGEYRDTNVLKSLIKDCEARKWAFVYLGANLDSFAVARNLGVSNAMNFDVSNMSNAFTANRASRVSYTCSVSSPENYVGSTTNLTRGVVHANSITNTSLDELIAQNTSVVNTTGKLVRTENLKG